MFTYNGLDIIATFPSPTNFTLDLTGPNLTLSTLSAGWHTVSIVANIEGIIAPYTTVTTTMDGVTVSAVNQNVPTILGFGLFGEIVIARQTIVTASQEIWLRNIKAGSTLGASNYLLFDNTSTDLSMFNSATYWANYGIITFESTGPV